MCRFWRTPPQRAGRLRSWRPMRLSDASPRICHIGAAQPRTGGGDSTRTALPPPRTGSEVPDERPQPIGVIFHARLFRNDLAEHDEVLRHTRRCRVHYVFDVVEAAVGFLLLAADDNIRFGDPPSAGFGRRVRGVLPSDFARLDVYGAVLHTPPRRSVPE
jgi:hypothetical protein